MQLVASQNAPSSSVVIPHFVIGGVTWLTVITLITIFPEALTQHYFNPKLLAITHLLVLGWISMVIFGALYQLIPVIMEVKLYSENLAIISYLSLIAGAVLLALSFWHFWLGSTMHIAASLVLLSVSLFVTNVLVTAESSPKKNIEKDFIQTAVIWLLFTVMVGIALAINLTHPFISTPHIEMLKLHAHAGIVGWFIQLIMGVGSKLLPMFMVSHGLSSWKLKVAYYLLNVGLIAAMICLFLQIKTGVIASIFFVILGVLSFLSYLFEAYKKRVKKNLDTGMQKSALSFIVLIIPFVLVLFLSFGNEKVQVFSTAMTVAYGSALFIGFISSLIMGQTYKTLPFIVWLTVYRNNIGKGKTPFPKDLYSEKILRFQFWFFMIGLALLLGGIGVQIPLVIRIGAGVLFISVVLYNLNIFKIIFHKNKSNG